MEELQSAVATGHEIHLYRQGQLFEGDVPYQLEPANDNLSTSLRLLDLSRRFDIPFIASKLEAAEAQAILEQLEIAIPAESLGGQPNEVPSLPQSEDDEADEPEETSDEWNYFNGPRPLRHRKYRALTIDTALLNVARDKKLQSLLHDQYPNLAGIIDQIEAAGGLREFVTQEYGPGYLAWDSVRLSDFKFPGSNVSGAEQSMTLKIWKESNDAFRRVFHDRFEAFVDRFLQIRPPDTTQVSNQNIQEQVLRVQLAGQLESEKIHERSDGYRYLYDLAQSILEDEDSTATMDYQAAKNLLKSSLEKESSRRLRKQLVEHLSQLAQTGDDTVIATDFADIVRQESSAIKARKTLKPEILSPAGMEILRGLFALGSEDATRAVWELAANPAVDPRLKKLCLRNLIGTKGQFRYSAPTLHRLITEDLGRPAQQIPWEDYAALNRIEKVSSTTIRNQVAARAHRMFVDIRYRGGSVASLNAKLGPSLPPEFFLPLVDTLGQDRKRLQQWSDFIGAIKSSKMQESFLYNVANAVGNYDQSIMQLLTDKIIDAPEPTKERVALADRLFKKLHALVFFQKQVRGTRAENCGDPNCSSCRGRRPVAEKPADITTMLKRMKAPSMLEVELDQHIVASLYEITGREDLTSDRIQKIFNAWEDPEPIFIFTSQLAAARSSEDGKRTMDLMSTMLANMDPPQFEEWKQWRYSTEDPLAQAQLEGLTPEQIEAYAEDDFTDLGDVLVGLLPSDKPGRIQQAIVHSLRHDWVGDRNPLVRAEAITQAAARAESVDFSVAQQDIEKIERELRLVDRRLSLQDSVRVLDHLPGQLEKWRKAESAKRQTLRTMGFRGEETREEIEQIISQLQRTEPRSKTINALATLKPGVIPEKTKVLLGRFQLSADSLSEQILSQGQSMRQALESLTNSAEYQQLAEHNFPGQPEVQEAQWRAVLKDLKAAQILLKLGSLTPQLIAFNKISPDKKKATLSTSLDYLRRNYPDHQPLQSTVERIQEIISEAGKPIGKDRLAVVFTDSPMALLTIGKFPHGATSCQNYENGDRVLAAYMGDASTKMCLLVDLNKLPPEVNAEIEAAETSDKKMEIFHRQTFAFLNASVGRRLTKIVRGVDDGQAKIFLEPVYTPLDRESTTKTMNAYAVTHLGPRLNLPLVRGGGKTEVKVAASRNYYQYEDGEHGGPGGGGGGIGTKHGSYSMSARPLKPKDYSIAEVREP